jgi:hypothetical protein
MDAEVEKFIGKFNAVVVEDCERFIVFARGIEFQQEAVEKLERLRSEILEIKIRVAKCGDNDSANFLLGLSCIPSALIEELKMIIALKEDRANDAWDNLIEAQDHVSTAIKAHDKFSYLEKYADKLSALEELLFPRQSFCSPGMIVRESECSICKQDYGECDHIKGIAYMGELCVRIIKKAEFRELSLVKNPANKHARALHFADKEGNRDMMTWRIKKETPEDPILSEREVEVTFPTNIPG